MRRFALLFAIALAMVVSVGLAQTAGLYKIVKNVKVGGDGAFDYVYADVAGRRLYIPRTGADAKITVFDLDTLKPVGDIKGSARGAAVDPKSGHGFASSKPVVMWDTKTLAPIKTIDVQGNPDGIMFDAFNQRVYVFSHSAPNATVINAVDGSIVGTIDLGGQPEQGVTDGAGHVYVDLEDKNSIAVVDAKTMAVTAHYDISSKGGGPSGLGIDIKNHILFAACGNPATMVMVSATDGKILGSVPIGAGVDGAGFNANTMEAFSSQRDGTLTVVKESSPTSFAVAENVQTKMGAKTMTIDTKTNTVLLITADYAAATPAPAGGRAPRPAMIPDSFQILVVGKQ